MKSIAFPGKTLFTNVFFSLRGISGNLKLTVDQYLTELRQIAANCDFESVTPDQLLRDRLVTGTKTAKVRENLLKEKKLTLEKAIDIARAAESTAVQMKVMSAESGLSAVKEKEKEQSENVPSVSSGWIKDCRFCGRKHERRSCPAFGQICAYCKKKNHFVAKCPSKSKVSTVQERFYLSAAGVGNGGREMVTLTVSKESKPLSGHDVSFLIGCLQEGDRRSALKFPQCTRQVGPGF